VQSRGPEDWRKLHRASKPSFSLSSEDALTPEFLILAPPNVMTWRVR
jgi:hypothetical protein